MYKVHAHDQEIEESVGAMERNKKKTKTLESTKRLKKLHRSGEPCEIRTHAHTHIYLYIYMQGVELDFVSISTDLSNIHEGHPYFSRDW